MNGTRRTKNQNVLMHTVCNIIVMPYVSAFGMFGHIRERITCHAVDNE